MSNMPERIYAKQDRSWYREYSCDELWPSTEYIRADKAIAALEHIQELLMQIADHPTTGKQILQHLREEER